MLDEGLLPNTYCPQCTPAKSAAFPPSAAMLILSLCLICRDRVVTLLIPT